MSTIIYNGQRWFDEGWALWGVSYKGDMYEGLILAVKSFKGIFVPEKFTYSPFGFGYYNDPWFEIKEIEDIRKYIDPSKRDCYVFGKIKILKSDGNKAWIDGIRFGVSNFPYEMHGYNDISIKICTDDWLLLEIDLKSHENFNKYFEKMKQTLRGDVTDYGGYECIGNRNGFDIEKVRQSFTET